MRNRTRLIFYTAIAILLAICGKLAAQAALPSMGAVSRLPGQAQELRPSTLKPPSYPATDLVPPEEPDSPSLMAALGRGTVGADIAEATDSTAAQVSAEGTPLSDLAPYTPRGWSYPVTPSSDLGTRTVNALYAGQPTYFDWAIINQGALAVTTPFQAALYVDGQRIGEWQTDILPCSWYTYVQDVPFTVSTPGWHSVRLVADPEAAVPESNELNNVWEYAFYWQAASQVNLKPCTPAGWSAAVVPSSTAGAFAASTLYVGQPTYINWAVVNDGNLASTSRIYTELYLDDQPIGTWRTDLLLPHWLAVITDWSYTVTTPGWHTLRLTTDVANAISESDETDNTWEGRFYWEGEIKPNLRPYAAPGWDAPLALAASPGEKAEAPLYSGQPVYIDWGIINDSGVGVSNQFEVHLYMDGLRIATWPVAGVAAQGTSISLDWAYLVNTPGWHTYSLVVDATSAIDEINEDDNAWEAKFWFQGPEAKTIGLEWVNNYFHSGLPPLMYNHINVRSFGAELQRVGWKIAFDWGDASAWEKDFKDPSKGGVDSQVVDAVSFVYFSGHGNQNGIFFDTQEHDYQLTYSDALWGNGSLNWIALDACLVLNNDNGDCITRWGPAFGGLHMILGFDTECYDSPYRGQNLARYADGSYWWDGPMSIREAWFHAAAVTEDSNTYSAALVAIEPPTDSSEDHLPGVGSYSADPTRPTAFRLWRVQN